MVINKFVVIYYLFLFCSVILGLTGGFVGLKAIFQWRSASSPETRLVLEKKLYLSSSAIFLGAIMRIIMIPIWFLMLQSLIPLIPGAMCLGGVFQNVPFYSWLASAMKLILPLFYFSWILISIADRKIVSQPFLRYKHYFLFPLILFVLAEALIDIKYLISIKPVNVTCCTAMFDLNTDLPKILTDNHWYFVIFFVIALFIQIVLMLFKNKKYFILSSVNSILLFFLFPMVLHTKLSPLVLDAPFHHCIFCLLQNNLSVLLGSLLLFIAIYLSFAYGFIGFASRGNETISQISSMIKRIKKYAIALYIIAFILILIPVLSAIKNKAPIQNIVSEKTIEKKSFIKNLDKYNFCHRCGMAIEKSEKNMTFSGVVEGPWFQCCPMCALMDIIETGNGKGIINAFGDISGEKITIIIDKKVKKIEPDSTIIHAGGGCLKNKIFIDRKNALKFIVNNKWAKEKKLKPVNKAYAMLKSKKQSIDRCTMCTTLLKGHEKTTGTILTKDKRRMLACCGHCLLFTMYKLKDNIRRAITPDFKTGRLIDADKAYYVIGNDLVVCCFPSSISFEKSEDAEEFKKKHGGDILRLKEAIANINKVMK